MELVIWRGGGLEDDAMMVELGGKDCVFVAEVKNPVECVGSTHRGCLIGYTADGVTSYGEGAGEEATGKGT